MPESAVLTYADFAAIPYDGLRRELIEGEIVVSPSPRTRHQDLVGRLFVVFSNHVDQHRGGRVFVSPYDVVFSDTDVVEPDVVFVADSKSTIITDANIQGVPSLLIEVVSNSRYDRIRKRDLYAKFCVPEYWIVDPDADRVEVYILETDRYAKPIIFEPGDLLTPRSLPGFQLDLAKLLAP